MILPDNLGPGHPGYLDIAFVFNGSPGYLDILVRGARVIWNYSHNGYNMLTVVFAEYVLTKVVRVRGLSVPGTR